MANKLWTVCMFILMVEVAERLCFYSISGSQRNFLSDYPNSKPQGTAGAINSVFIMLSYVSCFLGGYLADQWLGRYKTIVIFATFYFLGTVMVAFSSMPDSVNTAVYLVGCLLFVSFGTGAIKPNVMTFGASQYDETDPVEKAQQKTFFSYFYLMINVGAFVAYGFLINMATAEATTTWLGWGFFKVYVFAAAAMGFAVLCFVAGTCRYKKDPPTVHKPTISIFRSYLFRSAAQSPRGLIAAVGWLLIPVYITLNLVGSLLFNAPSTQLALTNSCLVLCFISSLLLVFGHIKNDWVKEFTQEIEGAGVTLKDAKKVFAMVPQMLLINIGFNVPYNAMNIAYPALACQMDLRIPGSDTQVNGAFTNVGDCFAIIVGVPLLENCIYPVIEKRRKQAIPRKAKFIAGFLLACLANGVAIIIEDVRRTKDFVPGSKGVSLCAPSELAIHMSEMSCFWAFIPMVLTGIGEILVNPVVYEFAYAEAPSQLLSIVQAFNLVAAGSLSNCITGPLAMAYLPDNFNNFAENNPLSGVGGGRGDINIIFIQNLVIGLLCLAAYMLVEKFDEIEPEGTSLERKDGELPLTTASEEQVLA